MSVLANREPERRERQKEASLKGKMSEFAELRRGGASRMTMFVGEMCAFKCVMIKDCRCLVWSGDRECLCRVCLASLVSVARIAMSVFLNESDLSFECV